ncbi:hypothetical protein GCM10011410_24330 [Hoyosella rhizosphaerae]|uniref:Uncharacterized protein n=1 Tax=Hoyosella rhizosphaerae TaxID=1755582 RepID=A0A916XG04_9ACTN|nr:hypothetical protein GCM10011410_24330 [Hoyosella rhizosphaerae]
MENKFSGGASIVSTANVAPPGVDSLCSDTGKADAGEADTGETGELSVMCAACHVHTCEYQRSTDAYASTIDRRRNTANAVGKVCLITCRMEV